MEEREIPTYCFDFEINDDTDEYYFYCPISGQNVVDQDEFPKELVMYFDNLEGDCKYLNPWAEELKEQYEQLGDDHDYWDLREYIKAKLPAEKSYYCLVITHPEGVHGDFIELYYEGTYPT